MNNHIIYLATGSKPFKVTVKTKAIECGNILINGNNVGQTYRSAAEKLADELFDNCPGAFVDTLKQRLIQRYKDLYGGTDNG